jgi:two-component system nitrate/nitrite response regulator NarL
MSTHTADRQLVQVPTAVRRGEVSAEMATQPGGGEQQRAIRVVAADDHAAYLRATTETLMRAGLDVVGVSTTGQGAIDDVRAYSPDVALVDLRMPGLSGTDVARTVCACYPGTRVVILSVYADEEIVQLALAAGATAYVTKDSAPGEIVRAVYRAAEGQLTRPG